MATEKKVTHINEENGVEAKQEEKINALIVRDEYGNPYRLEFTPRQVKAMERKGFKVDFDFPMSCAEDLWIGAFQAHYGGKVTPDQMLKIWKAQNRKADLVVKLVQLYMNPVNEFMADPVGTDENADPTWETV